MNRCLRPTLLSLALCAALPLHASEADASPDAAATGAERSPTELAAVRVQAGKPKADTSRVNAFGGGSWKDTPASVNVLERDYLDRRQVRSLSELASNDASLGDAYAPVGYYQNIAIRGFALDAAAASWDEKFYNPMADADDVRWQDAIRAAEPVPEDMLAPFLLIARAALDGQTCPDDAALGRAYGTSSPGRVRRLIDYMEKLGVIVARTDFSGKRSIGVPGLGLSTAAAD